MPDVSPGSPSPFNSVYSSTPSGSTLELLNGTHLISGPGGDVEHVSIRGGSVVDAGTRLTGGNGHGIAEGAVTVNVGSLYMRKDGGADTVLYVKKSGTGNTGWSAMAGA